MIKSTTRSFPVTSEPMVLHHHQVEAHQDTSAAGPFERIMRWLALKKYQIEVTYSVYIFTPVEKAIFWSVVFLFSSLTVLATILYLPQHLMFLYRRGWFYFYGTDAPPNPLQPLEQELSRKNELFASLASAAATASGVKDGLAAILTVAASAAGAQHLQQHPGRDGGPGSAETGQDGASVSKSATTTTMTTTTTLVEYVYATTATKPTGQAGENAAGEKTGRVSDEIREKERIVKDEL